MVDYFLTRQYVFPFIFGNWCIYKAENKQLPYNLAYVLLTLFCGGLVYTYPNKVLASFEYVFYIFGVFLYSMMRSNDVLFSYTYSMLSAHFGGWLYELPYFHSTDMFYNQKYPFYINSQILSGVFLFYLLVKQGFNFNRSVIFGVLFFIVYEILFTVRIFYYRFVICDLYLLSRVGMMVMMFILLKGVKKSE